MSDNKSTVVNEARISEALAEKIKIKQARNAKMKTASNRSMADVPPAKRRRALIVLLRKMGAIASGSAREISELAGKLNYTEYDVYCLVYHKYKLASEGLVRTIKLEGARSLSAYLTKKGQTIELDSIG